MARTDVKITMDSSISKRPHLGHHLMDFANMLKAFIGSNYLAIAFAFRQSGIALGLVGLMLIATLTAHCCQLLVRCKYHTIQHLLVSMGHSKGNKLQLQGEKLHPHSNGSPPSSSSSASSDEERSNESEDDYNAVHKKLLRNLNFGDIGRLCMGRAGLTLVNSAVIVTQFGFCVGYCIFVGNTIHSMFPLYNCSVSVSVARPNVSDVIHQCLEVKHLNSLNSVHVDMGDMVERVPGVLHNKRFLSALGEDGFPGQVKDTTVVPTPPEMLSSFVDFLASDKVSILHATSTTDVPSNHTTAGFQKVTGTTRTSPADLDKMPNSSKNNTAPDDGNPFSGSNTTKIDNTLPISRNNSTKSDNRVPILDNNNTGDNKTTSGSVMPNVTSTEHPSVSEISTTVGYVTTARTVPVNGTRWTLLRGKHIPDLKLLVLLPVVLFVPMTLIRNLRHLGFISIIANAAIFIGCIEVFLFLISGFAVSDTFAWANWRDMPIFFGMVTSAFEGIGTILPIESSMEGNRHNFLSFLYGAVAVLTAVLGCFGVLGYLSFGEGVEQMINANIPTSHWLGLAVNACLCTGVVLTFPLMMYPVVEMAEVYFFGDGRLCGPQPERVTVQDHQSLLPKKESTTPLPIAQKVSDSVAAWKRNTLRILIVLCAGSLAILLRNYFAYISAFVGALGSTMLAYILPCVFHLKLCWPQLSLYTKVKDITIIGIGIFCGVAGVYAVLLEIFSGIKA